MIWVWGCYWIPITADESILALQSKHILNGEIYFSEWGQSYNGNLESFLILFVQALFGSSVWIFRSVNLVFSICIIFIMTHLVRKEIGETAALFAALLISCPSP